MAPPSKRRLQKQKEARAQRQGLSRPDEKAQDSQKPCHFFKLPAELRNKVYELVLTDKQHTYARHYPKGPGFERPRPEPTPEAHDVLKLFTSTHPITQVNKQVRIEALPMATQLMPLTKITIRDFTFSRLLTFFDHWEFENDSLPWARTAEDEELPDLVVELVFSSQYDVAIRSDHPGLHELLVRKANEFDNAARTECHYVVRQRAMFSMQKGQCPRGKIIPYTDRENPDRDVYDGQYRRVYAAIHNWKTQDTKWEKWKRSWPSLEEVASRAKR